MKKSELKQLIREIIEEENMLPQGQLQEEGLADMYRGAKEKLQGVGKKIADTGVGKKLQRAKELGVEGTLGKIDEKAAAAKKAAGDAIAKKKAEIGAGVEMVKQDVKGKVDEIRSLPTKVRTKLKNIKDEKLLNAVVELEGNMTVLNNVIERLTSADVRAIVRANAALGAIATKFTTPE